MTHHKPTQIPQHITSINGYKAILEWSESDQYYITSFPALPYCMSDGETIEQAIQEAEIASYLWLKTAREMGRQIPATLPDIEVLAKSAPLLNKSELARRMGIQPRTLSAKIENKVKLTDEEAIKAWDALQTSHLTFA